MDRGQVLVTGGTDNHLMVLDLRPMELKGRQTTAIFDEVGITFNANGFPGHGGTPFNPNGIRMGTPAVTSRGMGESEMDEIAGLIDKLLRDLEDPDTQADVRRATLELCARHPLPYRVALTD